MIIWIRCVNPDLVLYSYCKKKVKRLLEDGVKTVKMKLVIFKYSALCQVVWRYDKASGITCLRYALRFQKTKGTLRTIVMKERTVVLRPAFSLNRYFCF